MELKETLLMPKTPFKMKAGLGMKEPNWQNFWKENDVYNKRMKMNEKNDMFYLHDGPPYANGDLHVGHALNKIIKDMIIRYKNMSGFNSPFICGWDTHGLPIEQMVTKKGINRKTTPPVKFREECEKYAYTQIEKQVEQFERMGLFTDFSKKYVTLTPEYETKQLEIFYDMFTKGHIFKGSKPVYWSWSSESALAEAEIEYADKRSPSIYVACELAEGPFKGKNLVIWTTTPWTIPANRAVAVGEKITYVVVENDGKEYIVAKKLANDFIEAVEFENGKVKEELTAKEIVGSKYKHPLTGAICPVVIGHHATDDSGTGMVHIAPGHGEDDFIIGQNFNLETACVVDGKGVMNAEAGKYEGLFFEDANKEIGMALESTGNLLKLKFIKHSYPHDWRTKKPIMFRATPQWFVTLENLKDDILKAVNKEVKWKPDWGKTRLANMMENRGDWCISRQRLWGVPIPLFYDKDGNVLEDTEQNKLVLKLVKENGTNIWYEKETDDLLLDKYKGKGYTKEMDIMDVWFDSGTSYYAASDQFGLPSQVDLYLEGSDQYRGWFNSSLITSIAYQGKAPYKQILSHGFVLDGKGKKMSKSIGNTIDPFKVCKTSGADILRVWVAQSQFTADIRCSEEIIRQSSEVYRKIRNSFKFALGNLTDFDSSKLVKEFKDDANIYMMNRLDNIIRMAKLSYDNYEFLDLINNLTNYITNDLSAFFFDITKDDLYCSAKDSSERLEIQTVIYHTFDSLLRILTPIIPHTCEEAYQLFEKANKKDSVMLEDFASVFEIKGKWDKSELFFELKIEAQKIIEEARNEKVIGKSLEVSLMVPEKYNVFKKEQLEKFLIVSNIEFGKEFKVSEAKGKKCERCWKIHNDSTDLCSRCEEVVKKA